MAYRWIISHCADQNVHPICTTFVIFDVFREKYAFDTCKELRLMVCGRHFGVIRKRNMLLQLQPAQRAGLGNN